MRLRPWTQKPPYGVWLNPRHPLTQGLVGFWALQEAAGVPYDVVSGLQATSNAMTWQSGPGNHAKTLNNNAGANFVKVTVPAGAPLDIAGVGISYGGWVYPTISNAYQIIISKTSGGAAGRQYSMYLSTNGTGNIYVTLATQNGDIAVSPGWTVNAWNHIILVYNGFNIIIYINGVKCGSASASSTISNSSAPIYMGYDGADNSFGLNGNIDAIGVWKRVLTENEVFELYRNTWQIFQPRRRAIMVVIAAAPGVWFPDRTIVYQDFPFLWPRDISTPVDGGLS